MPRDWTVEFYRDENGREPCRQWMEKLRREQRIALETAIEVVLAERGLDVVETEYGKPLGGGLYEFRLRWTAAEVRAKAGRSRMRLPLRPRRSCSGSFFALQAARSSCFSAATTRAAIRAAVDRIARSLEPGSCCQRIRKHRNVPASRAVDALTV